MSFSKFMLFWSSIGGLRLVPKFMDELSTDAELAEKVQGLHSFIRSNPDESDAPAWASAYKEYLSRIVSLNNMATYSPNEAKRPSRDAFLGEVGAALDLMAQARKLGLPEHNPGVVDALRRLCDLATEVRSYADHQEIPEWKLEEGRVYVKELEDAVYAVVHREVFVVDEVLDTQSVT